MTKMFAVNEAKVTRANRADVEAFRDLTKRQAEGRLKTPGKKKLNRLQTRLMREGVIRPLTQDALRAAARDMYQALPWWKKLHLRFRYFKRVAYVWIHNRWTDLKLKLKS